MARKHTEYVRPAMQIDWCLPGDHPIAATSDTLYRKGSSVTSTEVVTVIRKNGTRVKACKHHVGTAYSKTWGKKNPLPRQRPDRLTVARSEHRAAVRAKREARHAPGIRKAVALALGRLPLTRKAEVSYYPTLRA